MKNKQTAVDFLKENLPSLFLDDSGHYAELFRIASEMEKQQHKETWFSSTAQFDNAAEMTYKKDFEQYYSETYKSQQL